MGGLYSISSFLPTQQDVVNIFGITDFHSDTFAGITDVQISYSQISGFQDFQTGSQAVPKAACEIKFPEVILKQVSVVCGSWYLAVNSFAVEVGVVSLFKVPQYPTQLSASVFQTCHRPYASGLDGARRR